MKTLWENPLLQYHLLGATRHRWKRQPWLYGAATLGTGLVYLLALQTAATSRPGVDVALWFSLFVMCLAAPLMAYNLLSSEYEKRTWESLALTRLTAREIFWGKWGTALTRVAVLTLLLTPFLLLSDIRNWYATTTAFVVLFGWGTLLASLGVWLSFKLKRTLTTASVLYAGQVFVLLLFPMLYFILGERSLPRELISAVQSYGDAYYTWIICLFNGAFIIYINPFYVALEMENFQWLSDWWWMEHNGNAYQQGLRYMLWGFTQGGIYLGLALLFAGFTYRGIKISWRK